MGPIHICSIYFTIVQFLLNMIGKPSWSGEYRRDALNQITTFHVHLTTSHGKRCFSTTHIQTHTAESEEEFRNYLLFDQVNKLLENIVPIGKRSHRNWYVHLAWILTAVKKMMLTQSSVTFSIENGWLYAFNLATWTCLQAGEKNVLSLLCMFIHVRRPLERIHFNNTEQRKSVKWMNSGR